MSVSDKRQLRHRLGPAAICIVEMRKRGEFGRIHSCAWKLTSTPRLHVYKHSMFSSSPLDGASSLISQTPVVGVKVVTIEYKELIIPDSEVM